LKSTVAILKIQMQMYAIHIRGTAGQLKNIILGEIVDDINTLMVDYATAKEYASHLRRKVIRVHWQIPAKIRIYVNL